MSFASHNLGVYAAASTENPLGRRPFDFALKSPMSKNPTLSGASLAGMTGYYPAEYYVPTPLNISMNPQANILGYLGQNEISAYLSDPVVWGSLAVIAVLYYVMKGPRRARRRR
jgi:hypothetical protein